MPLKQPLKTCDLWADLSFRIMVCRLSWSLYKVRIRKMDLESHRPPQRSDSTSSTNYPMASQFPITFRVESRPIETCHVASAVKEQTWHWDKLPVLVRSKQMANNIKHQQPAKELIAIRIIHFAKGMEEYRELVPLLEGMRKYSPFIRISNLMRNTVGII